MPWQISLPGGYLTCHKCKMLFNGILKEETYWFVLEHKSSMTYKWLSSGGKKYWRCLCLVFRIILYEFFFLIQDTEWMLFLYQQKKVAWISKNFVFIKRNQQMQLVLHDDRSWGKLTPHKVWAASRQSYITTLKSLTLKNIRVLKAYNDQNKFSFNGVPTDGNLRLDLLVVLLEGYY